MAIKNLILIFITFSFSLICINSIIDIPIKKIKNPNYMRNKMNLPLNFTSNKPSIIEILITSDYLLGLPINIGTPYQTFNVILDSGSYALWVGEEDVISGVEHFFTPSESTSFVQKDSKFSFTYVTGYAKGYWGTDKINIGSLNTSITFGVANDAEFECSDTDGIFGFGYNYDGMQSYNIIRQLKNSGMITNKVFSIKYYETDTNTDEFGSLYLGEYPDDFTSSNNSYYCGISQPDDVHWYCRMSYIIGGNNTAEYFEQNAIKINKDVVIDSGSNANLAPLSLADNFLQALGGDCSYETEESLGTTVTLIACNSLDDVNDLSLVLNGNAFKISKENFFDYYDKYYFNFYFYEGAYFLLGTSMFRDYHILFDHDKKQIHFMPTDESIIGDVSEYTSDKDYKFYSKKKIYRIIIIALIGLLILSSLCSCICKRKKRRAQYMNKCNETQYQNPQTSYQPPQYYQSH